MAGSTVEFVAENELVKTGLGCAETVMWYSANHTEVAATDKERPMGMVGFTLQLIGGKSAFILLKHVPSCSPAMANAIKITGKRVLEKLAMRIAVYAQERRRPCDRATRTNPLGNAGQ